MPKLGPEPQGIYDDQGQNLLGWLSPNGVEVLIASFGGSGSGSVIYFGSANPSSSGVALSSFYLNTTTGAFFSYSTGSWVQIASLIGPAGSQIYNGSSAPSSGLGNNGDYYLLTANGELYQKVSGTWTTVANLTGPTGASGGGGSSASYSRTVTASGNMANGDLGNIVVCNTASNAVVMTILADSNYSGISGTTTPFEFTILQTSANYNASFLAGSGVTFVSSSPVSGVYAQITAQWVAADTYRLIQS